MTITLSALCDMVVSGKEVAYTTNSQRSARRAFEGMLSLPLPDGMTYYKANGRERIEHPVSGGVCWFMSRHPRADSFRGHRFDALVIAEAGDLTSRQLSTLLPTVGDIQRLHFQNC